MIGYQNRYIRLILPALSIAIASLLTSLSFEPSQENDIRSQLTVIPSEVYPKIIALIPSENWEKISECVISIRPLLLSIDEKLDQSLTSQLDQNIINRNKDTVRTLITKLAVMGSVDYLASANEENRPKPKEITRVSFAEYLSVENQFKKKHFKRCQQIVLLFRRSYASINNSEQFQNNVNQLVEHLEFIVDDLQ